MRKTVSDLEEALKKALAKDIDSDSHHGSQNPKQEDSSLTNENTELNTQKQSNEEELSNLKTRIDGLEADKARLSKGRADTIAEAARLTKEIQELKARQTVAEDAKQDNALVRQCRELEMQNAVYVQQITKLDNDLVTAGIRVVSNTVAAQEKAAAEIGNLKQEAAKLRRENTRLEAEKKDAEARDKSSAQELMALRARNSRLEALSRPTVLQPRPQQQQPLRPPATTSAATTTW